ncbi:hypothetical protein Pmar_PMAR012592 [Perkinsus marinus ATCC 50983]|uniref:Adenylate kinase n=1 Tax=Perkinsus marinus (strain ATCC 50983 / TXsc) TaxID=423536 RepID=C5K7S4_PERM5|nr:hypothetical protein Pmar_PMAR012592 [Perkinsus marinus ATCC 50983]EER19609.1 hypothetical protein Pmar_PMAR012592 [Perkinsus marinus ATCC 50983]|eukprot:XP_002787813.1 hypothetical protein Pmar_PMAR012592 [Perkinsus marinus ATCC 50983]
MRIFINNADTYVGSALCADLQNILETPTRIYATLKGGEECQVPLPVKRIVSRRDHSNILKAAAQSQLAVFDLHSSDLEEVDFVLRRLKSEPIDQPLVDEDAGEASVSESARDDASAADQFTTPTLPVKLPRMLMLDHSGWRRGIHRCRVVQTGAFESLLELENTGDVSSIIELRGEHYIVSNSGEYVVCSGILYGNGEIAFYDDFRAAWLGQETHRIIGDGDNIIPTIHVRDLARCVKHLSAATEKQPYIVAVDESFTDQKGILTAVVNHLGEKVAIARFNMSFTGAGVPIPSISRDQAVACLDGRQPFLLDLRFRASDFFHQPEFSWWSKEGPVAAIDKLIKEFCTWRNLRPLKLVLIGPPASGKSFYATKVAENYRLAHITLGPIIEGALKRGREVKELIDPENQEDGIEALDVDSLLEKDRFYLAFLEQWEKLQTPRSTPRLPAQLISRAVRYVLEDDNACKFRGWAVMFDLPALIVNDAIRPGWVFLLDSNLESCRRKEVESHGEVTVLDALNGVLDGQMVCREIRVDGVDADDVVDIMAQCIEYDGCPYNYLPSKRDEVESKTIEMEREELRRKEAETRVREEALAKEAAEIEIRRCAEADRLKQVRDNEQQILEKYSRSLRDYLLDNVVPVLREGIIEACEKTPDDAVSFLAESVELTESSSLELSSFCSIFEHLHKESGVPMSKAESIRLIQCALRCIAHEHVYCTRVADPRR